MAGVKPIKGPRGAVLPGRAREIIYNVNKLFEGDKLRANELLRNLALARIQGTPDEITISYKLFAEVTEFLRESMRVIERVVRATGVTKNTVTKIKQEGMEADAIGQKICTPVRKPRKKSIVLDNCDLYALSKLIIKLYVEEDGVPTLNKILAKAKIDLNFQGSMTTLRRILSKQLEYKIKRGADKKKQLTMTRPNISGGNSSDEEFETEYLEMDTDLPITSVDSLNGEEELT